MYDIAHIMWVYVKNITDINRWTRYLSSSSTLVILGTKNIYRHKKLFSIYNSIESYTFYQDLFCISLENVPFQLFGLKNAQIVRPAGTHTVIGQHCG